ncbi:hypothetical protein V8C34DRAFT_304750 [Trichoderma compactum]
MAFTITEADAVDTISNGKDKKIDDNAISRHLSNNATQADHEGKGKAYDELVAFGVALPVIFISGSINTTVIARFIHGRIYRNSITRYVNAATGWVSWLAVVGLVTLVAWIIAEAIPFFSELLSTSSSLFVSGLSFYLPPVMWFVLLREGKRYERRNWKTAFFNGSVFIIGMVILVCGTYASIVELIHKFQRHAMQLIGHSHASPLLKRTYGSLWWSG